MITTAFFRTRRRSAPRTGASIPESRFPIPADSTYRSLYESGSTFADFVSTATTRKEQWEGNYAMGLRPTHS